MAKFKNGFTLVLPDPQFDYLFDQPKCKYNTNVKLHKDDNSNTRILCKESYAQELYNKYNRVSGCLNVASKDLVSGDIYSVSIKKLDVDNKMAYCEELSSKTLVIVPFSEFKTSDVDMMSRTSFKVITTLNANGAIYGSIKKYQKVESFDVLGKLHKENTPFDVKIVELVKGGFIAKYNSNVDCFLPGAHAAPNVIYNFESYIGKTVSVMVDNFDKFSNLFVVSHKKFIKNEIPKRINNLEFGKRYRGTLTSNPSKIGLFIEFEGIFTGLVHMFDFKDYNEETRHLRSGDEVDIYIKNVSIKDNGEYRINLTLNAESVDQTSLCYQEYKNKLVGGEYDYEYSEKTQQFVILSGGKPACTLNIPHNSIKKYLDVYKLVCVTDVDVIGKQVYFDFLK